MITEKWYSLCGTCGDKLFPNADKSKMTGITVHQGTCPRCGLTKEWLVPISDYEYAMGDDTKWD